MGRWQDVLSDVGEVDAVITDLAAGSAAEHMSFDACTFAAAVSL